MKRIALLRGINVGGHKRMKMADLRALFESLGFAEVGTYIQSGNVIFDKDDRSEAQVIAAIQQGIENRFGYEVPIIVREHDELEAIIESSPFVDFDAAQEGTRYLVSFLGKRPDEQKIDVIHSLVVPPEKLFVQGREVYLHSPAGYGNSKLTPNFLEKKLGVTATTRNWKSLLKLQDLSKS